MFLYEEAFLKVFFYKTLLIVNSTLISLKLKEEVINIKGESLFISFLDKHELHIKGNIKSVEIEKC